MADLIRWTRSPIYMKDMVMHMRLRHVGFPPVGILDDLMALCGSLCDLLNVVL